MLNKKVKKYKLNHYILIMLNIKLKLKCKSYI